MAATDNLVYTHIADKNKLQYFDHPIHYAILKESFLSLLNDHFRKEVGNMHYKLRSRESVKKLKATIKEGHELIRNGSKRSLRQYKINRWYDIVRENGEEVVIIKRKSFKDPIVQVIGAEDSFDILLEAYRAAGCGLGYWNREKMISLIKKKFNLTNLAVDFFIRAALLSSNFIAKQNKKDNECRNKIQSAVTKTPPSVSGNLKTSSSILKFNNIVNVYFIDMTDIPDGEFKYILVYQDKSTKFILLRPLLKRQMFEATAELVKIITDFGPPNKIETPRDRVYNRIFKKVQALLPVFEFYVESTHQIHWQTMRSRIDDWIETTGKKNWAVGCHILQSELNNGLRLGNLTHTFVPFNKVFCYSINCKQAMKLKSNKRKDLPWPHLRNALTKNIVHHGINKKKSNRQFYGAPSDSNVFNVSGHREEEREPEHSEENFIIENVKAEEEVDTNLIIKLEDRVSKQILEAHKDLLERFENDIDKSETIVDFVEASDHSEDNNNLIDNLNDELLLAINSANFNKNDGEERKEHHERFETERDVFETFVFNDTCDDLEDNKSLIDIKEEELCKTDK